MPVKAGFLLKGEIMKHLLAIFVTIVGYILLLLTLIAVLAFAFVKFGLLIAIVLTIVLGALLAFIGWLIDSKGD